MTSNNLQLWGGERIAYIDYLKGATIIGVIYVHTDHFDWWTANCVNTIFFFVAGMFFKQRDIRTFISKNVWSLLVPFLFFYLLSYPFRAVVNLWDYRDLSQVNWSMIFDLFKSEARSDYLYVNVPLWFILCIFWVQTMYWGLKRLGMPVVIITLIAILYLKPAISTIPTPFMLNNAVCWLLFFGVGDIVGKRLITQLESNTFKITSTAISLIALIAIYLLQFHISVNALYANVLSQIYWLDYCILCVSLFSFIPASHKLDWLTAIGVNTLVILGIHVIILVPIGRIAHMLIGNYDNMPTLGLLTTILCMVIMTPIIKYLNKAFPSLIGKKKQTALNTLQRNQIINV